MESHVRQHHRQVGQQGSGIVQQVVDQQADVLDLLVADFEPPARVERAQVSVTVVVMITMVMIVVAVVVMVMVMVMVVVVVFVQDPRRDRGRRDGGHRRLGHTVIGLHCDGSLDPHADIVGLVQRDRNGVDTKEIRGYQDCLPRVIGGQLGQGGHNRQSTRIRRGRGFVTGGDRGTVDTGPVQPRQIRKMCGDVPFRARPLPRSGLHSSEHRREFVCHRGIFGTQRRPCPRGRQHRTRTRPRVQQRRVHLRRRGHPYRGHEPSFVGRLPEGSKLLNMIVVINESIDNS